jgi:hypothetical protein
VGLLPAQTVLRRATQPESSPPYRQSVDAESRGWADRMNASADYACRKHRPMINKKSVIIDITPNTSKYSAVLSCFALLG